MDRASSTFAKVAAAANELGRELRGLDKTNVAIDADISQVRAAVTETEARVADLKRRIEQDSPQLDLDIAEAEAKERKLRADLDELRRQKVTPEVELKVAQTEAQLGRLNSRLEELRAKKVTPEVHAEMAQAEADLSLLNARLVQLDARRVNIPVDVDTAKAHGKIETLDKSFGAATIRIAALGRAMGALAMPGAIVAALPAVASLGASAVTTAGALWLLPAAALAGAGAAGTLAVGFAHVSDALGPTGTPAQIKKVNEALAALSPQARATVETIRGLGPAWSSVRLDVQERLFAGMAATVGNLASIYLPILKTGLGGIATELNRSATGLTTWAAKGRVVADMGTIFEGVRATMAQLAPVATSVASMFTNIGVVGMQFLPGLAAGFAGAAASAAAFVARARETGDLAMWIQNGLNELQLLGSIAGNVGGILGNIFAAAKGSGESFLVTLDRLTGQLSTALQSPAGGEALRTFFETTRMLVGQFVDKVIQAWPAIAAGAGAFAALMVAAAPLSNVLFGLVVSVLTPLLHLVTAMAPVLGPLAVTFFAVSTAVTVASAAMNAFRVAMAVATAIQLGWRLAMGTSLVLTEAQTAAMTAHSVAARLAGAAAAVWSGAQWVVTAALNGTLFSLVAQRVAMVAAGAASLVVRGATAAWAATQWVLNAALAANPIGLVVIAIAALVAGLIYAWNNSETFRAIVIAGWEAIRATAVAVFTAVRDFIVSAWSTISTAFSTAVSFLGGLWSGFWGGLQLAAQIAWTLIVGLVQTSWAMLQMVFSGPIAVLTAAWSLFWSGLQVVAGAVWGALQAIVTTGWALLTGVFRAAVAVLTGVWSAFWNGLTAVATTIWAAISGFYTAAFAAFQAMFSAVWGGISAVFTTAWNAIRTIATTVWGAISAYFTASFAAYQALFSAVWNGIVTVFTTVWNFIRTTATTVWAAISAFFTAAFAAYSAMFGAVWNAISTVFLTVWNAIRNTAITVWNAIAAFFAPALAAFQALFTSIWNAISAFFLGVWNGLRDTAVNAWNGIRSFFGGVFSEFTSFFASTWNNIVATFDRIWSGITTIATRVWGAVRGAFVGGVNGIIDVINVFAGAINKVAGLLGFNINLGIPRLGGGGPVVAAPRTATSTAAGLRDGGEVHYKQVIHRATGGNTRLRRGGKLPYTGANRDTLPAFAGRQPYALMGEEYVVRRSSARALGSSDLNAINNADRRPVDIVPRQRGGAIMPRPVADNHGPFLRALGAGQAEAMGAANAYGGREALLDGLASRDRTAQRTAGGEHARMHGYATRPAVARAGINMAGEDLVKVRGLATGGDVAAWAQREARGPYVWGGCSPGAYDCSGWVSALVNVARGNHPWSRLGNTDTMPWAGLSNGLNSAFGIGYFKGNPGHTAATITGVNTESGSGHGAMWGGAAHGATAGMFTGHASVPQVGGQFAAGPGGGGFLQTLLRPIVEALLKPLRDKITPVRDNVGEGFGKRMVAGTGVKLIDFLVDLAGAKDAAGGGGAGMDVSGIAGPVVDQVRQVAARYGWDQGPEWDALSRLIQKESGWDPNAANPTSNARGLFQKMTSAHGPVEPTPAGQAAWGLNYIKGRYGSPTAAWAFHQANGHYDRGGVARGRGVMMKDVIAPERMLSPRQTLNHERLTDVLSSAAGQRMLSLSERVQTTNPVLERVQRVQRGRGSAGLSPSAMAQAFAAASSQQNRELIEKVDQLQRVIREARPVNVYPRNDDATETGRQVSLQMRL